MPIYEYACPDCGEAFERLQKMSEPAVTVCPGCGLDNVRKLISQTSFVLKGGGWYKDHYGLKGSSGGESKPAAADQASTTAPAGEAKTPVATPAGTPETKTAPAPVKSTPTKTGTT